MSDNPYEVPIFGVDDDVEEGGGITLTEFCKLQLVEACKVTLFAKGERFELPNVLIDGQPWSRGGIKRGYTEGGTNTTAYFIRRDSFKRDGEMFTTIDIFNNTTRYVVEKEGDQLLFNVVLTKADKTKEVIARVPAPNLRLNEKQQEQINKNGKTWVASWNQLQAPALEAGLTQEQRTSFGKGVPIYVKCDLFAYEVNEDTQGNVDDEGKPKKYYEHYRHNFTVYANEFEWLAAKSNNDTVVESIYPADWVDNKGNLKPDVEAFVRKTIVEKGMETGKAELLPFIGSTTRDGKPVDKDAVITTIVGSF